MSGESAGLRQRFAWPLGVDAVWLASPLFVLALAAIFSPIRPFDYFWALVQGRACVQLGRIPTENAFLYTLPAGAPFFDQPWLSQLAMFWVYRTGGHAANLLVLALCLGLSFALLIDTALRLGGDARVVALVALLAVPLVVLGAGVRTQMFAYPCFAILLRQAALSGPEVKLRSLLVSVLVAAFWANVHGSFVLAPLLLAAPVAAALVDLVRKRGSLRSALNRSLACLAAAIGTCLNPSGPWVYVYVARLGRSMRVASGTDVAEWRALSLSTDPGLLFAALALASLGPLLVFRQNSRPALTLLFLSFGVLSLSSQRFVCWWALAAIVTVGPLIQHAGPSAPRGKPVLNALLVAFFGGTLLTASPGMPLFESVVRARQAASPDMRVFGRETPVHLVDLLALGEYPGRLFHNQAIGGLLEWALARDAPKAVAFVDQRFELIPAPVWRDYFAISEAHSGYERLLERYGVGTLLIHDQQDAPLVKALSADPAYTLVARERGYSLFMRRPEIASRAGERWQ